jgi:hypothetical protein
LGFKSSADKSGRGEAVIFTAYIFGRSRMIPNRSKVIAHAVPMSAFRQCIFYASATPQPPMNVTLGTELALLVALLPFTYD